MASKKKDSNRNRWLLIFAVFIVLFLVAYHLLPTKTLAPTTANQTTTSETANWKTHEFNNYAFRYPDGYHVEDSTSLDNNSNIVKSTMILNFQRSEGAQMSDADYYVGINESKDSAYVTDSLISVLAQNAKEQNNTIGSQKVMKVNGFDAVYQEVSYSDPLGNKYSYPVAYVLDGKGRVVYLSGANMDHNELFNQILSTFKFTQ